MLPHYLKDEVDRLRARLSGNGMDGMAIVSDSQMFELKDKVHSPL